MLNVCEPVVMSILSIARVNFMLELEVKVKFLVTVDEGMVWRETTFILPPEESFLSFRYE